MPRSTALPGHMQVSLPTLTANSLSYCLVRRFSLSLLDVANRCAWSPVSLISMTMRLASADTRWCVSSHPLIRFLAQVFRWLYYLVLASSAFEMSLPLRVRRLQRTPPQHLFSNLPPCCLCPLHTEASRDDSSRPFGHCALPPLHLARQGTQPLHHQFSGSKFNIVVSALMDDQQVLGQVSAF